MAWWMAMVCSAGLAGGAGAAIADEGVNAVQQAGTAGVAAGRDTTMKNMGAFSIPKAPNGMPVYTPDPGIDYKIKVMTPDPNINYTIKKVTGPGVTRPKSPTVPHGPNPKTPDKWKLPDLHLFRLK